MDKTKVTSGYARIPVLKIAEADTIGSQAGQ